MKPLLTFFALFGLSCLFAQTTLSGTVTDAVTGEGLPFATILSLPGGKGIYTDGSGAFKLKLKSVADSVKVSMIGYESAVLPINGDGPLTIALQSKAYTTEAISVRASKGKPEVKRYGNTKYSLVTNGYSGMEGTKVVRYLGGDWERSGTLQSVIYRLDGRSGDCEVYARVRIYAANQVGTSGGPGEELLHKSIVFPLKNSKQRYEIDLSTENINYPPEGLCVGVEFLGNDQRCGGDESRKNRFFVLYSINEAESVSFRSSGIGGKGWQRMQFSWGDIANVKFGARVTY